jgi:hypothetical protein
VHPEAAKNLAYLRATSWCVVLALIVVSGFPASTALAETGEYGEDPPTLYAINLMSTQTRMEPASFPTVRTAPTRQLYTIAVYIDGTTWYRLRLGFFASKADARPALASLLDEYPDAWISKVSDYERELSARNITARDTDKHNSSGLGTSAPSDVTAQTEPASDPGTASYTDSLHVDDAMLRQSTITETTTSETRSPLMDIVRRPDERRPDDQFQTSLFNRPLTIGGKYEASPEHRANYDLDSDEERDLTRVNQDFRLEMLWEHGPTLAVFLEPQIGYRWDRRSDREDESEFEIRRGQSWIYYSFLPDSGLALQIGRQNLKERRSWWWDVDLDAARLHFRRPTIVAELGIAKEVFPVSLDDDIPADEEDVTRGFARWDWQWRSRQHLEFFWLSERDRSGSYQDNIVIREELEDVRDAELDWLGARTTGRWKKKPLGTFFYWVDAASVSGTETLTDFSETGDGLVQANGSSQVDVRGWAIDTGLTFRPRKNRQLSFTASYAIGSGDDDSDPLRDRSFRQTGLNSNKDKNRGVSRFRYYGELLRPELSNLRVLTFAIGRRFLSASSMDLVYHNYQQVYADTFLRSARIDTPLTGENGDVGDEIDLVVGLEEWRNWELKFIGSVFFAGDAYGPGAQQRAYRADLQLKYIF